MKQRFEILDGMRGSAALFVVTCKPMATSLLILSYMMTIYNKLGK